MKRIGQYFFLFAILSASSLGSEPDLTEMDADGNGLLEPKEIPSAAVIVLSRYASLAKRDLSGPISIFDLERGRDLYLQELQGGSASRGVPRRDRCSLAVYRDQGSVHSECLARSLETSPIACVFRRSNDFGSLTVTAMGSSAPMNASFSTANERIPGCGEIATEMVY